MIEAPAARGDVITLDGMGRAVRQQIMSRFIRPVSLEILIAEVIAQRKFAFPGIPLPIHQVFAQLCGKRLGKVKAYCVSAVVSAGQDVDDAGDAFAIPHSRIVDEIYPADAFGSKCQHFRPSRHNAVDAQLDTTPSVNGRQTLSDFVHTDVGQRELLQNAVSRMRGALLRFRGINELPVGLMDYLCRFHFHFLKLDGLRSALSRCCDGKHR